MRSNKYIIFKNTLFWIRIALFGLLYYFFSLNMDEQYNFYDYAFHPKLFNPAYLVMMILIIIFVPLIIVLYLAIYDYGNSTDEGRAVEITFVTYSGIFLLFWLRHGFVETAGSLAVSLTQLAITIISIFGLAFLELYDDDCYYQEYSFDEMIDDVCKNILSTSLKKHSINYVMKRANFICKLAEQNDNFFTKYEKYDLENSFRKFVTSFNSKSEFERIRNSMVCDYKRLFNFYKKQYKTYKGMKEIIQNLNSMRKIEQEFEKKYYRIIVQLFENDDFIVAANKLGEALVHVNNIVNHKNKLVLDVQQKAREKVKDVNARFNIYIEYINTVIQVKDLENKNIFNLLETVSLDSDLVDDIKTAHIYACNAVNLPTVLTKVLTNCKNLMVSINLNDENRIGSFLLESPNVPLSEAKEFNKLIKVIKDKNDEFAKIITTEEFVNLVVKTLLQGVPSSDVPTVVLMNYGLSEYKDNCIKYKKYLELVNSSVLFLCRNYIEDENYNELSKVFSSNGSVNKLLSERDRDGNNVLHYLQNVKNKKVIDVFTNKFDFVCKLAFVPNNVLKIPFDNIEIYNMFNSLIQKNQYDYKTIFGSKSSYVLEEQCSKAITELRKNPLVGTDWLEYFDRVIKNSYFTACHKEIFNKSPYFDVPNTFDLLKLIDSVPDAFLFRGIIGKVKKYLISKIETFNAKTYKEVEKISMLLSYLTYSSRISHSYDEKEYNSDKPAATIANRILVGVNLLLEKLESGDIFDFIESHKDEYVKMAKSVYKENQNKNLYFSILKFDPEFKESNSSLDEVCVLLGLPLGTEPAEIGKTWKKQMFIASQRRNEQEKARLSDIQQKLKEIQKNNPNLTIF